METYTITSAQTESIVRVRILASTSDPLATIPEHERWLWQNTASLQSLARAKEDVRAGRVYDLGSFAQFVDIDDDE